MSAPHTSQRVSICCRPVLVWAFVIATAIGRSGRPPECRSSIPALPNRPSIKIVRLSSFQDNMIVRSWGTVRAGYLEIEGPGVMLLGGHGSLRGLGPGLLDPRSAR